LTASWTTLTRADVSSHEVDRDHRAANGAPDRRRHAGDDVQDPAEADELRREDEDRSNPEQQGDDAAHGRVVAELEIVADAAQVVFGGDPPHRRADPERQRCRSDRRGSHPPPRGDALQIALRGGAYRRSRADVRREHRGEDEAGAELAPGHEEI
jgi:hypothetical protein